MPATTNQNLSGVAESLLIPLCTRALESQRPDALVRDEQAEALVRRMNLDPERILADVEEWGRVAAVLRSREFDRQAQAFLQSWPDGVVVHIGCGLDTRLERVDNGRVEWYDLDLPEVIELREKWVGAPGPRQQYLAGSVLDEAWLSRVQPRPPHRTLLLAEGVFMYFTEAQLRLLFPTLQQRFPGGELVLDTFSPLLVWANNLRVNRTHVGAPARWALKRGSDVETWGKNIRLLGEYYPMQSGEPRLLRTGRLAQAPWILKLPVFGKLWGVFHYALGEAVA